MSLEPIRPGREVVQAPPTGLAGSRPLPDISDLHPGNPYGDVLITGLVRAQLGLTLGFLTLTVAVIGSLPIVATLLPGIDRANVAGLPVPLLVLGAGIYPVLVALGWGYVRLAERLERRFAELLSRST
ncbi:MAG TPA: hypothetical protein VHV79_14005 [Mycobacteriales bacterium]|nr:hypothetical protein [Mycobacteriales bacterium]